jgi:hypothetical protein
MQLGTTREPSDRSRVRRSRFGGPASWPFRTITSTPFRAPLSAARELACGKTQENVRWTNAVTRSSTRARRACSLA